MKYSIRITRADGSSAYWKPRGRTTVLRVLAREIKALPSRTSRHATLITLNLEQKP